MRKIYFIYLSILPLLFIGFACDNTNKPESIVPSESGTSKYIEGVHEGTATEGQQNIEGSKEGQQNQEGENPGQEGQQNTEGSQEGQTNEGENKDKPKFTSAGMYNNRNVEYGEPKPTTDVAEETTEEGGSNTRELVEPDVFRMSNNYLFVLNQYRGLTIVDLDGKSVVSNVPIYGYPRDLYIKDGRAYVLIGYTIRHTLEDGIVKKTTGSQLYIIDIQDIANPKVVSTLPLPGDFIDSRLLGNILYAVTSNYQYYYVEMDRDGDASVGTSDSWTVNSGSTCWITSVDVSQIEKPAITDQIKFPGYGTVIQASVNAIYVCAPVWENNTTQITYVDITDPNGKILAYSPVIIPGGVADRFKLDEWSGTLRVVSNTNGWQDRHTYLTIFDISDPSKLNQISQITIPDAQGETLYATRFAGPLAYLVTYLTVDPLFVVDISDPAKPEVKGQLKVPGWSIYIEPIGDQLIGLGVDDTGGQRRVKVSWFDVSNPQSPSEVSTVSIGEGWAWSSAFNDVKAFKIFGDLIVVPFSGWINDSYKEQLQFIRWDVASKQLVSLGAVDMKGQVSRTVEYKDYYYAISSEYIHEIQCDKVNPPTLTSTLVKLAEYVADVLEADSNGNLFELIQRGENQTIELQLTNNSAVISSISIKTNGQLMDSIRRDNNLLLVLNEWTYRENYGYESYYRLVNIQKNDENQLAIQKDVKVNLTPYYSWYWGWCRGCEYMPEVAIVESRGGVSSEAISSAEKSIMPYYRWWYPTVENTAIMICGDLLILRGWGSEYDVVLGDELTTPNEGIAIVPFENIENIKRVGFGYDYLVSLSALGDKLFLTTQKYLEENTKYSPVVAYYLREINPKSLEVSEARNVPGIVVASNTTGNILFMKDWQYEPDSYNYTLWIRSIIWEEDKDVSIIDSIQMPYAWAEIKVQPPYLLSLITNNMLVLEKADIETDGKFANRTKTEIGEVWASFLGIDKNQIYLQLDGASMLTINTGYNVSPQLNNLVSLPSYPNKFRIGTMGTYLIFGYAGYLFVPLTD